MLTLCRTNAIKVSDQLAAKFEEELSIEKADADPTQRPDHLTEFLDNSPFQVVTFVPLQVYMLIMC